MISIITPLYNSEKYIQQSINSVINQSYRNWELLIIDDNSTDESRLRAESIEDKRIKIFCLSENKGAGHARNFGISEAKGKYIAFLDSDDIWHPNKLKEQVEFMEKNKINFSFTSYGKIDSGNNYSNNYIKAIDKVDYKIMLRNNYIGCLTAMYNQEVLGKMYMPTIRKRQDWALWLKILEKEQFAHGLNKTLAYYRIGNNSLSSNKLNLVKSNFDFYNKYLGFGLIMSTYYFVIFLFSHINYKIFYTKKIN